MSSLFVLFENVRSSENLLRSEFLLPVAVAVAGVDVAVVLLGTAAAAAAVAAGKGVADSAAGACMLLLESDAGVCSRVFRTCSTPSRTSDIGASLGAVVLSVSVGRICCSYSSFILLISASVTSRSFSSRTSLPRLWQYQRASSTTGLKGAVSTALVHEEKAKLTE